MPVMTRSFMLLWVHVLPFLLLPLAGWAWHVLVGDARFTVFVLGLPVLYGYLVPGVATTVFGLWRFTGARLGGILWHHGIMWAGNLALLLLIPFLIASPGPLGWPAWAGIILASAATHGFTLWVHDLGLLSAGLVVINNPPARQGREAATVVAFYAPWCFPLLGGGYALAALIAREVLVGHPEAGWWPLAWLTALGLLLLWLPATVVWVWRHGGVRAPAGSVPPGP